MTPELTALTLAALLQVVQFVLYAVPANLELGSGYTMSARDREPSRQMSDKTRRLGRAMDNHFEGLILFGIAVGVVQMSGQNTVVTATCAWAYLAGALHSGLCLRLDTGPLAHLGCGPFRHNRTACRGTRLIPCTGAPVYGRCTLGVQVVPPLFDQGELNV